MFKNYQLNHSLIQISDLLEQIQQWDSAALLQIKRVVI